MTVHRQPNGAQRVCCRLCRLAIFLRSFFKRWGLSTAVKWLRTEKKSVHHLPSSISEIQIPFQLHSYMRNEYRRIGLNVFWYPQTLCMSATLPPASKPWIKFEGSQGRQRSGCTPVRPTSMYSSSLTLLLEEGFQKKTGFGCQIYTIKEGIS